MAFQERFSGAFRTRRGTLQRNMKRERESRLLGIISNATRFMQEQSQGTEARTKQNSPGRVSRVRNLTQLPISDSLPKRTVDRDSGRGRMGQAVEL